MKKCYSILLSLALAVLAVFQGMPVNADEYLTDDTISEQMSEKEKMDLEISSKAVNNYRDIDEEPPISVSEYEDEIPQNYAVSSVAKYDPRQDSEISSGIPAVRDQNPLGTCWAHSAMAMVEMSLLRQGKLTKDEDMSEFQTVFFMNHDWKDPLGLCSGDNFRSVNSGSTALSPTWYDNGNNTAYTKFMLMDWVGTVSERDDQNTAYSILKEKKANAFLDDSYAIKKDAAHVQDVDVINTSDGDVIKAKVLECGAVGISYHDDPQYYKYGSGYTSFYNDQQLSTNHAVTVVGWDDNFAKVNFKTQPSEDGAWLVRNSWGSSWGDNGYFWISYKDKSLGLVSYAMKAVSSDDKDNYYDNNYQYDGGISSGYYMPPNQAFEEANIFTAKGNEILKAVAIYTYANYDYDIKVYKNLTNKNNPTSGTVAASVTGNQLLEGYHTVELDNSVPLDSGDTFSVVVKLTNKTSVETKCAADMDMKGDWIYSDVETQAEQSFLRYGENYAWMDIGATNLANPANLRIKAYTVNDLTKPAHNGQTIECTFDKLPTKLYKYNTYKISLSKSMQKLPLIQKIDWKLAVGTADNIVLNPTGANGKDGCELYVKQVKSDKNRGEKLRIDATVTYMATVKKVLKEKTKVFKKSTTSYNLSYDITLDNRNITFTEKTASATLTPSFNEGKSDDQPTNTRVKYAITDALGVKDKYGAKVASVSSKGVVKPKGPGTTYITVFAEDSYDRPSKSYKVKDTIKVVCTPVSSVRFTSNTLTLERKETANLKDMMIFNGGGARAV